MQTVEHLHLHEFVSSQSVDRDNQTRPKGTLVVIGGRAEKESLQVVVDNLTDKSKLYISALASNEPQKQFSYYKNEFYKLGVNATEDEEDEVSGLFFTGGNQITLMDRLGGSPKYSQIHELYLKGGLISGTSAGASFMSEIMPIKDTYGRGIGVVPYIIDQHFSNRSRLDRLTNLVRKFPDRVGIGVDENTAWIYKDGQMRVAGEGNVHLLIGHRFGDEMSPLHIEHIVMAEGEEYDLSLYNIQNNGM